MHRRLPCAGKPAAWQVAPSWRMVLQLLQLCLHNLKLLRVDCDSVPQCPDHHMDMQHVM